MGSFTIEVRERPGAARRLEFSTPIVVIGSSPECDLQLPAAYAAPVHARLRLYRTHVTLEPCNGSAAVKINGVRINDGATIGCGDLIQLGSDGPTLCIIEGVPAPSNSTLQGRRLPVGVGSGVPRPIGWGGLAAWIVATIFGVGALAAIGGIAVALLVRDAADHAGRITSLQDERKLSQAVGLVINGVEVSGNLKLQIPVSTGTAFAISPDGLLATNQHVIAPLTKEIEALRRLAPQLSVRQAYWVVLDGEPIKAEVAYDGSDSDFAMLKIHRDDLPYFQLSTANGLPRSSEVYALGYPGAANIPLTSEDDLQAAMGGPEVHANVRSYFKPQDTDYTLTKGIISRIIRHPDGFWVQHDTAISHGNSGGPLCLKDGTVIAINSRINPQVAGNSFSFMISQLKKEIESVTDLTRWSK